MGQDKNECCSTESSDCVELHVEKTDKGVKIEFTPKDKKKDKKKEKNQKKIKNKHKRSLMEY